MEVTRPRAPSSACRYVQTGDSSDELVAMLQVWPRMMLDQVLTGQGSVASPVVKCIMVAVASHSFFWNSNIMDTPLAT